MSSHPPRRRRWLATLAAIVLTIWPTIGLVAGEPYPSDGLTEDPAGPWAALKTRQAVALLRHAEAPGTDDPPGFALGDCTTQRNLSAVGRAQAAALGARLRAAGIGSAEIQSSQWCRCLETARLLGLGAVQPNAALNSFYRDRGAEPARTAAIRELIASRLRQAGTAPPLLLITHQVNMTALTGVFPASGELVIVGLDGDDLRVLARLR